MTAKDVEQILKKYNIPAFKSSDEKMELLEILHEKLETQYARTGDSDTYAELIELRDVINELKQTGNLLVQIEAPTKEEHKSVDISELKGGKTTKGAVSFKSSQGTQSQSGTQSSSGKQNQSGTQSTLGAQKAQGAANASSAVSWFVSVNGDSTIDGIFSQALGNLKFSQWSSASRMFDSILAVEPRNPGAFLGRFLCRNQIKGFEEIINNTSTGLENDIDLQKAKSFADPQKLKILDDMLNDRNMKMQYAKAVDLASKEDSISSLEQAAGILEGLNGYKDSRELARSCRGKAEILKQQEKNKKAEKDAREKMKELLTKFRDYVLPGKDLEQSKKELLDMERQINDLLRDFPVTKQLATDKVRKEIIEPKKMLLESMEANRQAQKRSKRIRKLVGVLFLLFLLWIGSYGYLFTIFWNMDYKASGIATYFPAHMGCKTVEYSDSKAGTFISFSPILEEVSFVNCPNMKKVIIPFSKYCKVIGLDVKDYVVTHDVVSDMETLEHLTVQPLEYTEKIEVKNCNNLKTIDMVSPCNLSIEACNSLQTINAIDGSGLTLKNCPNVEKIKVNYLQNLGLMTNSQKMVDFCSDLIIEDYLSISVPEMTELDLSKYALNRLHIYDSANVRQITMPKRFGSQFSFDGDLPCLEKIIIPVETEYIDFYNNYSNSTESTLVYKDESGNDKKILANKNVFWDVEYEFLSGSFKVSSKTNKYTDNKERSLTVNMDVETFKVRFIDALQKVSFENGIENITFNKCPNLFTVEFAEGTKSIVITECPSIKNWTLPESVTYCSINGEVIVDK